MKKIIFFLFAAMAFSVSVTAQIGVFNEVIVKDSIRVNGVWLNGIQTLVNTSNGTTHTVTLSDGGGSVQLVEGANITLTTTGTASNAVVTIAGTGGGGGAGQLSDLTDVNTSTPTAGHLLVADGTDWESTAMSGDATISGSGVVSLATGSVDANELVNTAVTPGSYTNASITVDADGRVTAAANGSEVDGSTTNELQNLTYTAATRALDISAGTGVTLPLMSSGNAGLVPASGGGTTNFLRADGTFAAPPGGGGSPGGSTTQFQYNNAGAFAGLANLTTDGTNVRMGASGKMIIGSTIATFSPLTVKDSFGITLIGESVNSLYSGMLRFGEDEAYINGYYLNYNGATNVFNFGRHPNLNTLLNDDINVLFFPRDHTRMGIGVSPLSTLDVSGNVTIGSGYAGINTSPTSGLLVEGNVGIGNNSPSEKLHVTGNILASGNNTAARQIAGDGTAGAPSGTFTNDTNTGTFRPTADTWAVSTDGTERFRVNSAGNFGIGTTIPTERLDIGTGRLKMGGTLISTPTLSDLTQKTFTVEMVHYNNSINRILGFGVNSGVTQNELFFGGGSSSRTTANLISFWTGATPTTEVGTERLRITSTGLIGIGTTSPARTLHVAGEMRVTDLTTDTPTSLVGADADGDFGAIAVGTANQLFRTNAGATGVEWFTPTYLTSEVDGSTSNELQNLTYTAATRALDISAGTGVTLPLVSSGNAGLVPASGGGTTNFLRADGTFAAPAGGVYIGDGTAPTDVDVTVTDSINFDAGTLFINGTSNRIGIGTASPSHLLHVNGTAFVGDLRATTVLPVVVSGTTSVNVNTVGIKTPSLGVGNVSMNNPSNTIGLDGGANRSIGVEATLSNGSNLTVKGGDGGGGTSNRTGGNLILEGGVSTGTGGGAGGGGNIGFATPDVGSSGTTPNAVVTRMTVQSGGNVLIGSTTPDPGAILQITSTTGGVLFPRMTTAQRDAMTVTNGNVIYNTTTDKLQVRAAGSWVDLH